MSGDNKAKKVITDKAEELFYRLTLRPDFRKDLGELRERFGILKYGFGNKEKRKKWFRGISAKAYRKFLDEYEAILLKYKLTFRFSNIMEDYALNDRREMAEDYPSLSNSVFCELNPPQEAEKIYRKNKKPFVKLLIFEYASEDYVRKYIEKSWKYIERSLRERGGTNKRLRPVVKKERNILIMRLYQKPKAELENMLGRKATYKRAAVAALMGRDYGIKVSEEAVEKVFYRLRGF